MYVPVPEPGSGSPPLRRPVRTAALALSLAGLLAVASRSFVRDAGRNADAADAGLAARDAACETTDDCAVGYRCDSDAACVLLADTDDAAGAPLADDDDGSITASISISDLLEFDAVCTWVAAKLGISDCQDADHTTLTASDTHRFYTPLQRGVGGRSHQRIHQRMSRLTPRHTLM